ncbi:hypothetical protein BV25DRAFT_1922680 [Artomyces pyxidatus]|uniref:Uncharacterized protein n=1 Tax=Artomyces pyxidatus TaxID=48021 RepID=A0ACB8SFK0_9AGAM|nr:hypothetical protein BV25DRAFT_1922680 [Artomyces pyxidatus]
MNDVLYKLAATERELMMVKILGILSSMKRLGVDLRTYMNMAESKQDFAQVSATGKSRDGLDNILKAPEYMEMLVGWAEFGSHFVNWDNLNPTWLKKMFLETHGAVMAAILNICEMPWRAILKVASERQTKEMLDATALMLNRKDASQGHREMAISLLMEVTFQPRAAPPAIAEDGESQALPTHDFRIIDGELYSDLANAYDEHFRPRVVELMTTPELSAEDAESWSQYQASVRTALEAWKKRALPHIREDDHDLLNIVDSAAHTAQYMFDNFHHLGMLQRVPFLNKYVVEDLHTVLSACDEGIKEVCRWVDGAVDIQLVTLNRKALHDYSRHAEAALTAAGLERENIQSFFCALLRYSKVELRHLSANLIDPKEGFLAKSVLTKSFAEYIDANQVGSMRRLLGRAAGHRPFAFYMASLVETVACTLKAKRKQTDNPPTQPEDGAKKKGSRKKKDVQPKQDAKPKKDGKSKTDAERTKDMVEALALEIQAEAERKASDSSVDDGYTRFFDIKEHYNKMEEYKRVGPPRVIDEVEAQRYLPLWLLLGTSWPWDVNTRSGRGVVLVTVQQVVATYMQSAARHRQLWGHEYIRSMFATLTEALNQQRDDSVAPWASWITRSFEILAKDDKKFAYAKIKPEDVPVMTADGAEAHYSEAHHRLLVSQTVQAAYDAVTKLSASKPLFVDVLEDGETDAIAYSTARNKDEMAENAEPGRDKRSNDHVVLEAHCVGVLAASVVYNNMRRRAHIFRGNERTPYVWTEVPEGVYQQFPAEDIIRYRRQQYALADTFDGDDDGLDEHLGEIFATMSRRFRGLRPVQLRGAIEAKRSQDPRPPGHAGHNAEPSTSTVVGTSAGEASTSAGTMAMDVDIETVPVSATPGTSQVSPPIAHQLPGTLNSGVSDTTVIGARTTVVDERGPPTAGQVNTGKRHLPAQDEQDERRVRAKVAVEVTMPPRPPIQATKRSSSAQPASQPALEPALLQKRAGSAQPRYGEAGGVYVASQGSQMTSDTTSSVSRATAPGDSALAGDVSDKDNGPFAADAEDSDDSGEQSEGQIP